MTVEELAAWLNAAAARRRISSEQLLDELAAHFPTRPIALNALRSPEWDIPDVVISLNATSRSVTN